MEKLSQLLTIAILTLASPASAHLELTKPVSRHGGDVLKDGPCGKSDSVRTSNVTTFAPGETIEVRWDEYVDHDGHFRIAFDADGDDDFVDPAKMLEFNSNAAVLMDNIQDTLGGETSVQVKLPDIECDRCTLQVIQVMYGKLPYVVPGDDIYYQCADLVLTRNAPDGGTMDGGDNDGGDNGGGDNGGGDNDGGDNDGGDNGGGDNGGGCSITPANSNGNAALFVLLAGLLLGVRRSRT